MTTEEYKGNFIRVTTQDSQYGTYEVVHTNTDRSVYIAVVWGSKILLVKQYRPPVDAHVWEFPGGGVDDGEDIITAGMRELYEETGIIIPIEFMQEFSSGYSAPSLIAETISTVLAVLPENYPINDIVIQENEIQDAQWIPVTEIIDLITTGNFPSFATMASILRMRLLNIV
jgi:8-oxo-dGTP pyrophosphatase MutT (NUDIX family)